MPMEGQTLTTEEIDRGLAQGAALWRVAGRWVTQVTWGTVSRTRATTVGSRSAQPSVTPQIADVWPGPLEMVSGNRSSWKQVFLETGFLETGFLETGFL